MKRALTLAGLALALTACGAGVKEQPGAFAGGDGPTDAAVPARQVLDVGSPASVPGLRMTMTSPVTYRSCYDGCTYPDSAVPLVSYATVHLRVEKTAAVGPLPGFSGWLSADGQVIGFTGMFSRTCDALPLDLQPGQWAEGCAVFAVPIGPGELVMDAAPGSVVVVEVDPS